MSSSESESASSSDDSLAASGSDYEESLISGEDEAAAQQVVTQAQGTVAGYANQPADGVIQDQDWVPDLFHFFERVVRVGDNSWLV